MTASAKALSETPGDEVPYLACESRPVFLALTFVAGFWGAFTYILRGGVFSNAQTANILKLSIEIGQGHLGNAAYYLVPMGGYIIGVMASEMLPGPIKRHCRLRWDTLLVLFEILSVAILGGLPETAPFQIAQLTINFLCAMQFNTFRQMQGIPMASTFLTNHVRQIGVTLAKIFRKHETHRYRALLMHFLVICVFSIGIIAATVSCRLVGGRAVWFTLVPLSAVAVRLVYADLKSERQYHSATPRGH